MFKNQLAKIPEMQELVLGCPPSVSASGHWSRQTVRDSGHFLPAASPSTLAGPVPLSFSQVTTWKLTFLSRL